MGEIRLYGAKEYFFRLSDECYGTGLITWEEAHPLQPLTNSFRRAALSFSAGVRSHHAEEAYYRSSAMVFALVTVCRAREVMSPEYFCSEVEKTKSPTLATGHTM